MSERVEKPTKWRMCYPHEGKINVIIANKKGYNNAVQDTNNWLKSVVENELSEEILRKVGMKSSVYGFGGVKAIAKHIKEVLGV